MKQKTDINNMLEAYGIGSNIIALINKKSDELPKYLNWLELGYLYFYAKHIRERLQPWIDKMQQHFADGDSETCIIVMLAQQQEELKELVVEEIVHIKRALPLHDFGTLFRLFPKLKGADKKLSLQMMKCAIDDQKNSEHKFSHLQLYYHICTAKKEKAAVLDTLIELARPLHDFQIGELYKEIPDHRIADLWLQKLEKTREFRTLVNAAIFMKHDAFYQRAKIEEIIGVTSDTCRFMQEKYLEHKDERLLDLWMHVITFFHKKEKENIISYVLEAYQATKDQRFFEFAKQHGTYFDQKKNLYLLQQDDEILAQMKTMCSWFGEAKEGLLATGDPYFMEQAKKYIFEKLEYGISNALELYQELMEHPKKHRKHINELKKFIGDNMEILWKSCTNTHDKHRLLEFLAS